MWTDEFHTGELHLRKETEPGSIVWYNISPLLWNIIGICMYKYLYIYIYIYIFKGKNSIVLKYFVVCLWCSGSDQDWSWVFWILWWLTLRAGWVVAVLSLLWHSVKVGCVLVRACLSLCSLLGMCASFPGLIWSEKCCEWWWCSHIALSLLCPTSVRLCTIGVGMIVSAYFFVFVLLEHHHPVVV